MQTEMDFDVCEGKHGGNERSRQAFLDNLPRSGTQRAKVMRALIYAGDDGMTCEEISLAFNMRYTAVSARLSELKMMKLIRPNGKTRKTSTGSLAAVLVTTEKHE